MKKMVSLLAIILFFQAKAQNTREEKIAFIADIHFLDIYADFKYFEGIPVPGTTKKGKIRTMNAQLHSTRLFNENYFVLKAVLDDIVQKEIKLVALPGDYTDDGQPINVSGLAHILRKYEKQHGINFFITTGNHDPVRPNNTAAGKIDFLARNGRNQPIFSEPGLYTPKKNENEIIIEPGLQKSGYKDILSKLSGFGFFPQQNYLYWETPFSAYNLKDYSFKKAKKTSALEKRFYKINDSLSIPDASYLVEPVKGLWILAIDGNTYIPQANGNFYGTGEGYNNAVDHKQHLFKWIKKITERAKIFNKKLVAFSHYPAVDFNDDSSPEIEQLLGKNKWQLKRVPQERIAKILAESGIKIHFAGHMHINDTGKRDYGEGKFLVNIQTPSLAAYIPGYKILKLTNKTAEINTIAIEEVPGFDKLFPLYKIEYDYLKEIGKEAWNSDILNSENYHDFTEYHLENLVKLRFLPSDWSESFRQFLSGLNGKELLLLAHYPGEKKPEDFLKLEGLRGEMEKEVSKITNLKAYAKWEAEDMILDFYKIRNADKLAFQDIDTKRLKQYKTIISTALKNTVLNDPERENAQKLYQFLSIFNKFLNGLPANNFSINMETGQIQETE